MGQFMWRMMRVKKGGGIPDIASRNRNQDLSRRRLYARTC